MTVLYLDLFSGISGDMFVGALLDFEASNLRASSRNCESYPLEGYHLHQSRAQRQQIEGVKFDVHLGTHGHDHDHAHAHGHDHKHPHEHGHDHDHPHEHEHEHGRTHAEIRGLIASAPLSPWVREKSLAIFQRIALAEGKIHGLPPEEVHFHEVGAVDSIVDIVGACVALEALGRPRILASHIVDGHGWIDCAHGRFPVPAPATLEILAARGLAVTQCDEPHELVTPTGAALLAELVESFGHRWIALAARRIGIGIGGRDNQTRPNVLRAILADDAGRRHSHDWETDTVAVLETNLDDTTAAIIRPLSGAGPSPPEPPRRFPHAHTRCR